MKSTRLYFIDAVRAFAIIMMLQGHFINTTLASGYKNDSSLTYIIWKYFRGNTAPLFFAISGLIFVYLLLKAQEKSLDNPRVKKGLKRGLQLIGIGYLLRIPFLGWITGYFDTYFLVIDVLQCIGLSLILIILIYLLVQKNRIALSLTFFVLGALSFLTEPIFRDLTIQNTPEFLTNYITTQNGSIFTIIPWFGFMAFGGFIATLFYKNSHKSHFKTIAISMLITVGLLLMFLSTDLLLKLYELTQLELINECAQFNYLFIRLGNVLVVFGLFYALENQLKHHIISIIGKNTLAIYVAHFIILYGSFIGYGLKDIFKNNLNPYEAFIGAVLFVFVCCWLVLNLGKIKLLINSLYINLISKVN